MGNAHCQGRMAHQAMQAIVLQGGLHNGVKATVQMVSNSTPPTYVIPDSILQITLSGQSVVNLRVSRSVYVPTALTGAALTAAKSGATPWPYVLAGTAPTRLF